jgi:beta-mannosidase
VQKSTHCFLALLLIAFSTDLTHSPARAASAWKIRIEEPTGIYRRTEELARVPLDKLPGQAGRFVVVDATGKELPWQVADGFLMFPVTLIPGELPEYTVAAAENSPELPLRNQIQVRRVGLHRVELGNDRFRVVIDAHIPAIIEAYSLTTGPQRMVNLVETTPEGRAALGEDIHASEAAPVTEKDPITGQNTGWTTLGGTGPMTAIELVETGPLRGRVRLKRDGETWELTWDAHSAALRWKASKGFRFAAISCSPYLPFDRFLDGSEYEWPTGPDAEEPPHDKIGVRDWRQLPGGHVVYYRQDENYGALGIVALDTKLVWTGIGSRRFTAEGGQGETEIALTFPHWDGMNSVLAARQENRILRQPVLPLVLGETDPPWVREPAEREVVRPTKKDEHGAASFTPRRLSLSGDWELAWAEKGEGPPIAGWRTVRVPGSAHTQWLEPNQIYSHAAEWISGKEWWYRRRFRVPEEFRGQRLRLQFEATDYYADVRFNGKLLGRHEGYLDPFEFDITDDAHWGEENEILVRVWAPVHYYWKHRSYTIKGSYGAVDQKPDDITPLGITRPVWVTASASAWIADAAVATTLTGEAAAEVALDLELAGTPDAPLTWEATLSPRNFDSPVHYHLRVSAEAQKATHLVIPVDQPQLWWTWDHGKPNLYTLEVRLLDAAGQVVDGKSIAVGIREIEKVGWQFYLNRKRLFIRGSNYYYHLYMSEMNRAAYARDLKLMLGMNINMIRLHCHFSNPEFYDLADEQGVLLWQDFLEAWYPEDRAFSLRAAALYDPLIRSVRNHPSIALWTTCDEESLENYRDLTKHLSARPAALDPQRRPVVRSTGRYGDAHVYHGWYGGSVWEYTQMTEEFVSELGATSLPNYETLIKFMPDQWPIRDHAQEWFFRRLQIPEALRAWGDPTGLTLQEYIPRTQAYVARLFQIALERMRRLKYHPAGGILHFHAIDIWPSVTMAAIDFDRVPTAVYDTVRRSFEPVLASIEYDCDRWPAGTPAHCGIWAINDRWESLPNATVRWQVQKPADPPFQHGEWKLSLPEDSAQRLGDAAWTAAAPGPYELRAEVRSEGGEVVSENVFRFEVEEKASQRIIPLAQ